MSLGLHSGQQVNESVAGFALQQGRSGSGNVKVSMVIGLAGDAPAASGATVPRLELALWTVAVRQE